MFSHLFVQTIFSKIGGADISLKTGTSVTFSKTENQGGNAGNRGRNEESGGWGVRMWGIGWECGKSGWECGESGK